MERHRHVGQTIHSTGAARNHATESRLHHIFLIKKRHRTIPFASPARVSSCNIRLLSTQPRQTLTTTPRSSLDDTNSCRALRSLLNKYKSWGKWRQIPDIQTQSSLYHQHDNTTSHYLPACDQLRPHNTLTYHSDSLGPNKRTSNQSITHANNPPDN